MTVISEPLTDPAGRPETEPLAFFVERIRQNASGSGLSACSVWTLPRSTES